MTQPRLLRISKNDARLGMFIHSFGSQWLGSPFPSSRFKLTNAADLKALLDSPVTTLVIDLSKGIGLDRAAGAQPEPVRKAAPDNGSATLKRATGMVRSIFSNAASSAGVDRQQAEAVVDVVDQLLYTRPASVLNLTRLKTRDEVSFQHSVAVCALVGLFARHLKLDPKLVRILSVAALLHDIGKVLTPTSILTKTAGLTADEMAVMQTHPREGYEILARTRGLPDIVKEICLHHHEKLDGSGYPDGLKGDEIGTAVRIVAICDVYDALTSVRPYKNGFPPQAAAAMMATWDGHLDQALLQSFFACIGLRSPTTGDQPARITEEMLGIAQADLDSF
jgi:putative nucleotidyltransferase with HDIG domain